MLDVRRMRVLREVAVRGSFSAAAEALSFTQSAISQQIAALEREAGTTLVQRSARGVRLTEAGEARRPPRRGDHGPARRGGGRAGGDRRPARRAAADGGVRVRGLDADAARDRRLPRAPPGRRAVDEPGRARGLASRCCAAASSTSRSVFDSARCRDEDGIDRAHLLEDPMYLALPLDHPLAHRRRLRLDDLADEAWVAGAADCECNRLISHACAAAGYRAADRLPDRRLHGDAGIRRGRRRRFADRRARTAGSSATTSSCAISAARRPCGRSTPRRSRRVIAHPRRRRCWRSSRTSQRATPRGDPSSASSADRQTVQASQGRAR